MGRDTPVEKVKGGAGRIRGWEKEEGMNLWRQGADARGTRREYRGDKIGAVD